MLYIHVEQRLLTEMYAQGVYEDDSYKNAVAGSILEDLSRKQPMFYLCSQSQKYGMAMPAKYTVMHDTIGTSLS